MARHYIAPWRVGQVGIAAQVARHGFADVSPMNLGSFGALRITFHGEWTKPETQFIRIGQLRNPQAHHISKTTWSNASTANDNLIRAFRTALNSITRGLGLSIDDFVSLETGRRLAITRNYEEARQSVIGNATPTPFEQR